VATGVTLAHCDVRADNLLVRPDGSVVVVDRPYGCIGPAWLDTVLLAMNVPVHGGPNDRLLTGVDARTRPGGGRAALAAATSPGLSPAPG